MADILLVSRHYPPGLGGSAVLTGNLFRQFPSGSYALVSSDIAGGLGNGVAGYRPYIPHILERLLNRFDFLAVPLIFSALQKACALEKPRLVFACYPTPSFLVAAYLLSRRQGLPLHVYMHDMWQENMHRFPDRWFSQAYESRILKSARAVYAITGAAAEYLDAKHNIHCRLLPHTVDLDGHDFSAAPGPAEPVILFSGAIYANMNLDAILCLVEALDGWDYPVHFHIYSMADVAWLASMGICGDRVRVFKAVSREDVLALQRKAAILYLPLAFETRSGLEIRTVFPTKATDYILARRPILLHAPPDCHTIQNAISGGWALVVDNKEPAALRAAITRLMEDRSLADGLARAAGEAASVRDVRIISNQLQAWLLK